MPSTTPSTSTTLHVARLPYLNSVPFFRHLPVGERVVLSDYVPRALGAKAAEGVVTAGLLPVVDFFRLEETFERIGPFGIAVRGQARSAILFSRKPLRQLDGAVIAVTEESSTTACLLRLLLEQRYHVTPAGYQRGRSEDADALLLIGDDVLRLRQANASYPYEVDVGFEWWLWQHLPFVFAVWAIRKDAAADEKKALEVAITKALARNLGQLDAIGQECAAPMGMPAEEIQRYLSGFIYRFSRPEEEGISQFRRLVNEHRLL